MIKKNKSIKKDYENLKLKGSQITIKKKKEVFYIKDWYQEYVQITPNQELFPTVEIK